MKSNREYYEPSPQWQAAALQATYARLANSYHVTQPRQLLTRTPHQLVAVRHALSELSLGVKSNDPACIWLAAEFVVSSAYFSGSGYIKAGMARRLRSATLDEQTKTLLRTGIAKLWSSGTYRREWREYASLLKTIGVSQDFRAIALAGRQVHRGVHALLASTIHRQPQNAA